MVDCDPVGEVIMPLLRFDWGTIFGRCGLVCAASPLDFVPARLEEDPLVPYADGGVELPT
jgi:hypothetical protein